MCQATVRGREFLSGADVRSYDLRGAAAMVIGGLMAEEHDESEDCRILKEDIRI